MKPSVLATRNSAAQKRIAVAAETIAFRCSVTAPTVPVNRDAGIAAMCYLENLATFLEALVAVNAAKLANVIALDGMSEESIEVIETYYGLT
jgi:hypothetical protein